MKICGWQVFVFQHLRNQAAKSYGTMQTLNYPIKMEEKNFKLK